MDEEEGLLPVTHERIKYLETYSTKLNRQNTVLAIFVFALLLCLLLCNELGRKEDARDVLTVLLVFLGISMFIAY